MSDNKSSNEKEEKNLSLVENYGQLDWSDWLDPELEVEKLGEGEIRQEELEKEDLEEVELERFHEGCKRYFWKVETEEGTAYLDEYSATEYQNRNLVHFRGGDESVFDLFMDQFYGQLNYRRVKEEDDYRRQDYDGKLEKCRTFWEAAERLEDEHETWSPDRDQQNSSA